MYTSSTSGGYDDEALELEFSEPLEGNQLLDFLENLDDFPFDPNNTPKDDNAKREFIVGLIRKLADNPDFDVTSYFVEYKINKRPKDDKDEEQKQSELPSC